MKSHEARIRSEERIRAEQVKRNVVKTAVAKAREDEHDLIYDYFINTK